MQLQRAASTLNLSASYPRAVMSGSHLSSFHGRGIEFDEVRPYQPGDDVRNMDWQVTARTGKPHSKLFREERERPVILMLDFRPAMFFATAGALKAVLATEYASLLSWGIFQQGDRLGSLIFSHDNASPTVLKPKRGQRYVLRSLGAMVQHEAWHTDNHSSASLLYSLRQSMRLVGTGGLIMIVSDGRGVDDDCRALLQQSLRHHDIIFVWLYDEFETKLPQVGALPLSDGQQEYSVQTKSRQVQAKYDAAFAQRRKHLKDLQQHPSFMLLECTTLDDPLTVLQATLRRVRK